MMLVIGDRLDYAAELLPRWAARRLSSASVSDRLALELSRELLDGEPAVSVALPGGAWRYLLLAAYSSRSQYDRMIELARGRKILPDRLVCVAGAGDGFHGFKGRPWKAVPGNLHLAVHLAPDRPIARFDTAFTVLATVSVVEAIDGVPGLEGRARIKWANDVLLEGAKVAGVLAYTQTQESHVASAVLGIGLNVEAAPSVPRTPSVPEVGAVRDFAPDIMSAGRRSLLGGLLDALDRNYALLLDGGYARLLELYRRRSAVIGREVTVVADRSEGEAPVIGRGRIEAIGEGLELVLEGRNEPITRGRVVLDHPHREVDRDVDGVDARADLVSRTDAARS